MGRANDNWERLVGAVMRRNRDWEMCHAHSRTPSMSSAASSRDDPFLDLSDDKFESRSRYINVEDQNLEALTRDDIKSAQGIGKTMMGKEVGEMVKQGRSYFEVMLMSRDYERPISGGGLSPIGKFSYGYASCAGRRSSMEDFYETRIDGVDGEEVGLFGVFDGHGGTRAAEYVQRNLFKNLISHPKFISDTKLAIADAHSHTDAELLHKRSILDVGSTACTAILVAGRLLVANVGDSRAVICRAGQAIAVSQDHKPNREDERRRIESAGGFVMWAGVWRVGGVLPVSRAFGNRMLKEYVVADPEIHEEKVDETLELLILASHGLWDVFTNVEAVQMTQPIQDPEEAAKMLMQEALCRGCADNITVVVVRFRGH